ncbi:sulfatase domain protein [Purpureocillium lavendulum]|uniref:Sulfatase domain protein n=1 Tax=Purpureocillium lavendulum TaxID=1247861 RepID=A0AB34FEI2_9HYPO|nr:sulfatase domain protein [Purpureocillium lavendulum]KAJ6437665.1 sulfatase domain protein [Purpureocillium lavendulum]
MRDLVYWGPSFFLQDTVALLIQRQFLDYQPFGTVRWARTLGTIISSGLALCVALLAAVSISFLTVAGSDIQWHNISAITDSSWWSMLSSGAYSLVVVLTSLALAAWLLQGLIYGTASIALNKSLTALSWTVLLAPVVDIAQSSPRLAKFTFGIDEGIGLWDNITALAEPIYLPWLPKDEPLPGFEDWYETGSKHYNAAADPLKISNLDDELLPALRDRLPNMTIRHVMIITLESARKDVFPIKRGGIIWEQLTRSFENKSFPVEIERRLATLTPTANFLTGDYEDGFGHTEFRRRGGLNANNALTTSSYTLKSLTGTLCGISPLVADFNVEHEHRPYQPCLPHVLKALNRLSRGSRTNHQADYTTMDWRSLHMQSATASFDNQESLMAVLGYNESEIVTKEYLQSDSAKFGKVTLPDVNYFSIPEAAIKDYITDALAAAKQRKERICLSHLTSTTHHGFGIPAEEQYVNLAGSTSLDDLSHYVNAVGYVDRWLRTILDTLEAEGASDETLLILVGDHGIPLAEGGVATYGNANIASFHIPLNPDRYLSLLPVLHVYWLKTTKVNRSFDRCIGYLVKLGKAIGSLR